MKNYLLNILGLCDVTIIELDYSSEQYDYLLNQIKRYQLFNYLEFKVSEKLNYDFRSTEYVESVLLRDYVRDCKTSLIDKNCINKFVFDHVIRVKFSTLLDKIYYSFIKGYDNLSNGLDSLISKYTIEPFNINISSEYNIVPYKLVQELNKVENSSCLITTMEGKNILEYLKYNNKLDIENIISLPNEYFKQEDLADAKIPVYIIRFDKDTGVYVNLVPGISMIDICVPKFRYTPYAKISIYATLHFETNNSDAINKFYLKEVK